MGLMKQDMQPVLQKYAGFGYTIYFLYQEGRVSKEDIRNVFLKLNPEIAFLYLEKVVHKIETADMIEGFKKTSQDYSEKKCLEEYFGMNDTKISLKKDVYETALNYHYTDKILQDLKEETIDVKEHKMLDYYQAYLGQMIKETKESVMQSKNTTSRAR